MEKVVSCLFELLKDDVFSFLLVPLKMKKETFSTYQTLFNHPSNRAFPTKDLAEFYTTFSFVYLNYVFETNQPFDGLICFTEFDSQDLKQTHSDYFRLIQKVKK